MDVKVEGVPAGTARKYWQIIIKKIGGRQKFGTMKEIILNSSHCLLKK